MYTCKKIIVTHCVSMSKNVFMYIKNYAILFFILIFTNFVVGQTSKTELISYEKVQIKPEFPSGIGEFMFFFVKNYQVPEDEEFSGVANVSIVIDADGKVTNIKIINDVGFAIAQEIKRVLSKCPKWKPASQEGINVPVIYNFPIKIQ